MWSLLIASLAAFFLGLVLTPGVRRTAVRLHLVDQPDKQRKLHTTSTPLGGGVAVLAACLLVTPCLLLLETEWQPSLLGNIDFILSLGGAAVIIALIGLADDRFRLRGRQKLLGQVLAVGVLLIAGLRIDEVQMLDWRIQLGVVAVPFTIFWLLGAINAFNLLDGIDGLATGIGIIFSLAVGATALCNHHPADAVLAFILAGALAGFLVYNAPPASIFLGDAGSMLIGLVLGTLAVRCSLKGPATFALTAPAAIWAIPILDVSMAIVRRKLTGRSIYSTDRSHLHHRLLRRGMSDRRTVTLIAMLCVCTASGALVSVYQNDERLALGSIAVVFSTLFVTRLFGDAECRLVLNRTSTLLTSFVQLGRNQDSPPQVTRLQGTREWDSLWQTLIEFAERFDLHAVRLNVSVPAINEEFHANWKRKEQAGEAEQWHTEIPLVAHGVSVGRLRITGARVDGSICSWMGEVIAGLKAFEVDMLEQLEDALQDLREAERELQVIG